MLQTPRQVLRILILSVGFILFVVVAVKSAAQANSRQALAGKPNKQSITGYSPAAQLQMAVTSGTQAASLIAVPVHAAKTLSIRVNDQKSDENSQAVTAVEDSVAHVPDTAVDVNRSETVSVTVQPTAANIKGYDTAQGRTRQQVPAMRANLNGATRDQRD